MIRSAPTMEDLITALKEGDIAKVVLLLQHHRDLLTTAEPHPWLHLAVNAPANCRPLLLLLLEAGISSDTPDAVGITALHLTAKKGQVKCLQDLLQWKVSVDVKDNMGLTPLHYAAFSRHRRALTCIKLLIQAGASRDAHNNEGLTPLHVAVDVGNISTARTLLDLGASHALTDARGRTPLHLASTTKMAETLLSAGANVTCEDGEGHTPLDRAIKHFPDIVPTLLGAGVAVQGDPQDKDLRVFFHLNIISGGQGSEVKLLKTMVHYGHYDLLKHPLCETFLHLKWLLIYQLLYIKWATCTGAVASVTANLSLRARLPLKDDNETNIEWLNNNYTVLTTIAVLQGVSAVLLSLLLARTIMQMLVLRSRFWHKVDKLLELVFLICSAGLVAMRGRLETWERQVGALTLLLGWYNVTVLIGHIPSVGIYVQMFNNVAVKIIKFTVVFSSLLFGFAISFHLSFERTVAFQTVWSSCLKTLAMMVGELDLTDLLESDTTQSLKGMPEVLFVVFVLFITVVIANLLVGLAVQNIQDLLKVAGVRRLALTVEHEAMVDQMYSSHLISYLLPDKHLAWLRKKFSLLQQFPSRFLSIFSPRKHTLATFEWWTFEAEAAYTKCGHMNRYNVFIQPYDTVDPAQVYCRQSNKQKPIPTGFKLPSWIIRNTRILLESGIQLGTSNAAVIHRYDSDNNKSDTVDISLKSENVILFKLQEQINDLKESIATMSQLKETHCNVSHETML
nr:transient receptor potential channel pyrexia-like [Procambarus clarkii]